MQKPNQARIVRNNPEISTSVRIKLPVWLIAVFGSGACGNHVATGTTGYVCDDAGQALVVRFDNQAEPRSAMLTYGGGEVVVQSVPAASGAKYASDGVEFWEHQGKATVDWYGKRLLCRVEWQR